jgi:hypothetical protein
MYELERSTKVLVSPKVYGTTGTGAQIEYRRVGPVRGPSPCFRTPRMYPSTKSESPERVAARGILGLADPPDRARAETRTDTTSQAETKGTQSAARLPGLTVARLLLCE